MAPPIETPPVATDENQLNLPLALDDQDMNRSIDASSAAAIPAVAAVTPPSETDPGAVAAQTQAPAETVGLWAEAQNSDDADFDAAAPEIETTAAEVGTTAAEFVADLPALGISAAEPDPVADVEFPATTLHSGALAVDGALLGVAAIGAAPSIARQEETACAAPISLVDAPLGQRLRAGREARGWSVADTAARLHLPSTVVQALESGDYARIGNGVYLRGYLLSYLRLLDLPLILLDSVVEQVQPEPPLVTTGAVSHPRYLYNRYSVPTIYLILTGLIVVPAVWLTTHGGLEQTLVRIAPLDTPAEAPAIVPTEPNVAVSGGVSSNTNSSGAGNSADAHGAAVSHANDNDAPLIASFTPPLSSTAAVAAPAIIAAPTHDAGAHHVRLSLSEESWVEILGNEGKRLDYGLLPAGTSHEYYSDGALDVRIGNSNGAVLEVDGHAVDLAPYRHANVARLKLFSDGDKTGHSDS